MRSFKSHLLNTTVLGTCLSCAQPAIAQTAGQSSPDQAIAVEMTAGTLQSTIEQIERAFQIEVMYPRGETATLETPAIVGRMTAEEALRELLSDTTLTLRRKAEGHYRILRADESKTNSAISLGEILVVAYTDEPGVQRLEKEDIRRTVRSDLAEALSVVPSVRVADTASSSLQQGDLKPAEFSIRGAAPYQNKIMLDGASIDSFLDPAFDRSSGISKFPSRTQVEGHSQALFIDSDFLSSLEVIDVNASAREGGFTGGVVKAETRGYVGENEFDISHRRTSSDWTEFHVDETQLDEFERGAGNYPTGTPGEFQPNFDKSETAVSGATRVGDVGLFAGFSEKRATIRQKQAAAFDLDSFLETGLAFKADDERSVDRHSRFFTLRADALETPYDLSASLSYSDYSEDSFLINFLESDFQRETEGLNLSVNYGTNLGDTRLDVNVNAGRSSNERVSERDFLYNYTGRNFYTEGAFIGAYGNLSNIQHTLGTDMVLTTPLGDDGWNVNYGGELKWSHYQQDRKTPFTDRKYQPPTFAVGGVPYEDHHLYEEKVYQQGEISFTNMNAALFGELEGSAGRFFWRPGIRLEYDGWLENTNVAPRLMAGMHLDDAERYQVKIGANRYYGKSFLSYRLRERERELLEIRRRTATYDPNAPFVEIDPGNEWEYRELDTPYDDELSIGLYGRFLTGQFGVQAVLRKGEDQIRTQRDADSDLRWYANTGSSETKQVDLYWRSDRMDVGPTSWYVNTSASWMDKETDADFGDDSGGYLGVTDRDEDVIYEGSRIPRYRLPADDFAIPISANLDVITQLFGDRVTVANGLAFTDGYEYLDRIGTDGSTGLDEYEVREQGSTLRWDLSVEAKFLPGKGSPYIKADVINVTDNENVISSESGVQLYGLGRQYWLELGYRF